MTRAGMPPSGGNAVVRNSSSPFWDIGVTFNAVLQRGIITMPFPYNLPIPVLFTHTTCWQYPYLQLPLHLATPSALPYALPFSATVLPATPSEPPTCAVRLPLLNTRNQCCQALQQRPTPPPPVPCRYCPIATRYASNAQPRYYNRLPVHTHTGTPPPFRELYRLTTPARFPDTT